MATRQYKKPGDFPNCRNNFWAPILYLVGAGVGDIGVEVEDPQGKNPVEVAIEDKGNQVYRCVYKPLQAGPHTIKVAFAGEQIPKSPWGIHVGEGMCLGQTYNYLTILLDTCAH